MKIIENLAWVVYRIGLVGSLMSIATFFSVLTLLANLVSPYLGISTLKLILIMIPILCVGLIVLGQILWKNKYQDVLWDQANQKNPQLMEIMVDLKEIKADIRRLNNERGDAGKEL